MDEWAIYSRTAIRNGTPVPIFPKNRYIFFSLPNFKKSVEEVDDELLSDQENAMAHEEDYEIMLAGATIRAQKEGLEKGLMEGREKGLMEGLEKGRAEEKRNMARALKAMGDSVEKIVAVTGLTQAEVEAL